MMESEPTVFWLTGLSGAGKTTIGKELVVRLRDLGEVVVFLDGDVLREVFANEIDHTRDSRLAVSLQYSRLCNMLVKQGVHVVCCTISLFHETQDWNRENIKSYIEVLINVPIEELIRRDSKKVYSGFYSGEFKNVVGIDIEPEWPRNPDLIINNTNISNIQQNIDVILQKHISSNSFAKEVN